MSAPAEPLVALGEVVKPWGTVVGMGFDGFERTYWMVKHPGDAHADVNAALNILSRAGQARIHAGGVGGLERPTWNPEPYTTSTEASYVA